MTLRLPSFPLEAIGFIDHPDRPKLDSQCASCSHPNSTFELYDPAAPIVAHRRNPGGVTGADR